MQRRRGVKSFASSLVAYWEKQFAEPFLHNGSLLLFLQIQKTATRLKRSAEIPRQPDVSMIGVAPRRSITISINRSTGTAIGFYNCFWYFRCLNAENKLRHFFKKIRLQSHSYSAALPLLRCLCCLIRKWSPSTVKRILSIMAFDS